MAPFLLKSLENKKSYCNVFKCFDTNSDDILQKIGVKKIKYNIRILTQLLIWSYYCLEIIFGPFKSIKTIDGVKIGFISKEFGIIKNAVITVVGKAIYNKVTKQVRFD